MPKISVVIPIYNVEQFLDRCLKSVLNQSFIDFEVLCINDGTQDNSQSIIDEYVKKDSRFKSFIKKNGGLSDARNYGIQYVEGDYIFFLDSDDYIEPNCLEDLYNAVLQDNADLAMCGYNEVNYDGTINKQVINNKLLKQGGFKNNLDLLCNYPHCAWNKLYSKRFFKELNIRYPKGLFYEDVGTTPLIYLEANNISYINKPLINYVVNRPGNITTTVNKKIVEILDNLKIVNDYYINKGSFNTYKDQLCYFNLDMIFDNLYKSKWIKDDDVIDKFFDDAYNLLNNYFDNWKNNKFFKKYNFIKQIMLKNKDSYKKYIKRNHD